MDTIYVKAAATPTPAPTSAPTGAPTGAPTYSCQTWCASNANDWSTLCTWDKCAQCDECATAAPTAAATEYTSTDELEVTDVTADEYNTDRRGSTTADAYECAFMVSIDAMDEYCALNTGYTGISSSAVANRRSDGITVTFVVTSSTEALKEAADSKMEGVTATTLSTNFAEVKTKNPTRFGSVTVPTTASIRFPTSASTSASSADTTLVIVLAFVGAVVGLIVCMILGWCILMKCCTTEDAELKPQASNLDKPHFEIMQSEEGSVGLNVN